jgi:hypothetical protein
MKLMFAVALYAAPVAVCAQGVLQPAALSHQGPVLRTGTPVALKLAESISTKEKLAKINDRVRLEVVEPVLVDGVVVIPAGSLGVGELTDVRNKGMWGKSGRIVGRVLNVNVNGRTIRMSGTFDSKGGSGTAAAVGVSAIVFLPAGFFMTGKSAAMPVGTIVKAFVDEDIALTGMPAAAPAATMAVASAPAPTAAAPAAAPTLIPAAATTAK